MANACGLFRTEEQVVYTDELAEQFAKEAGVPPRPQETRSEIDDRGAFIRQPSLYQPFGEGVNDLKAEANSYAIYWAHGCHWSNRPCLYVYSGTYRCDR